MWLKKTNYRGFENYTLRFLVKNFFIIYVKWHLQVNQHEISMKDVVFD